MIKISLITACYNSEASIADSFECILRQKGLNKNYTLEYIVVDGGSVDTTHKVIAEYEIFFSSKSIHFQWISEKDKGIGDAWNKGLSMVSGDVIGLLNADDMYHPKTLDIVSSKITQANEKAIYYGICKFIKNGDIVGVNDTVFDENKLISGFGFTHTTCFIPKNVYDIVGNFNIDVKIAVDTEFLLRCYKAGIVFKKLTNITYMSLGGISDAQAKNGYFEYLDFLKVSNLVSAKQIRIRKRFYSLYYPFRKIFKSITVRSMLRQAKHYLVFAFNILYNYLPFFSLKKTLLRAFGASIGNNSYLHPKIVLYRWGMLNIGSNTVINQNCRIDNRKMIEIGNNVSIAHGTKIYTCGHDIHSPFFDILGQKVIIGDYVCIFANSQIMPGVTIGEGAVIYPGSLVNKDVEAFSIVGGNPAKEIGRRDSHLKYKINYGYHKAL